MPKKTKKEKKLELLEQIDRSDTDGSGQDDDEDTHDEKDEFTWMDDLGKSIDELSDKKSATRISSLEKFIRITRAHHVPDLLEKDFEGIFKKLLYCFSHGDEQESILAARALELFVITVGNLDPDYLKKASDVLMHIARDKEQSEKLRKQSINTFALINYISAEGADIIKQDGILDQIQNNFWKEKVVSDAGFHAWTLLQTCIPSGERIKEIEKNKNLFYKVLEEHSFETMIEVGECIALLYESLYEAGLKDKNMARLLEKIEDLSKVHTKKKSKKEKQIQRATFRDVFATMESGEPVPVHKLVIGKTTFEFASWSKVIKYHQFRERLGMGIQEHFQKNHLIQEIFDIPNMLF